MVCGVPLLEKSNGGTISLQGDHYQLLGLGMKSQVFSTYIFSYIFNPFQVHNKSEQFYKLLGLGSFLIG